jgi:DNA-binding beta-propeller fold protein YncE
VDAVTGIITTVAGNGAAGFSGDGGAATSASLNGPMGIAVDAAGNIYVADTANHRLR